MGKKAAEYAKGLWVLLCYVARRKAPALWTALAAAFVFYGFPRRFGLVCFCAAALGGFSIALGQTPGSRMRAAAGAGLALALGLVWGAAAALSESARAPPGELSRFSAENLCGKVLSDSRLSAKGKRIIAVELSRLSVAAPGWRARLDWPRGRRRISLVTDSPEEFHAGRGIQAVSPSLIDASAALCYASAKNIGEASFSSAAARARSAIKKALAARVAALSGRSFPLAQALLLGITDEIDHAQALLFRQAGCAHILSLSGQHLSILCMLMNFLFAKALKRADIADAALLVFIFLFVWIAGLSPSLLRSAIMTTTAIFLRRADRPQQGISVLSFAFCLGLGLRPQEARSLSFTLSYAAMAGLIVLSPRWEALLWRLPRFLSAPLSASLAALCATAPLSLSAFGALPLGGILASVLSGPLILAFMWSLLAAAFLTAALPFAQSLLSSWHETLYGFIVAVMRAGALFPSLRAETAGARTLSVLAVAALSLFVYAYPYVEQARKCCARPPCRKLP